MKLQVNAGNKDATNAQGASIANTYENKFIIPLDFKMLGSTIPYYQLGLGNRLCYELMFNDYNRVIISGKQDAKYEISDISLDYEIVTHPDLARLVSDEYQKWLCLMTEF